MPQLSYAVVHDEKNQLRDLSFYKWGTFTPMDLIKVTSSLDPEVFSVFELFSQEEVDLFNKKNNYSAWSKL